MPKLRSLARGVGAASLLLGVLSTPAHAADPVVAAAGDIACDPTSVFFNNGDGTEERCRQKYTSDLLVGQDLAAVLTLGDTQYELATLEQFQLSYDLSWGRIKPITRPAIGNHEYDLEPGGYFDYFNGIGNNTGPAGDRDKAYYSFSVGSWHLIALNSMCEQVGGCTAGSVQEQWLRTDLAENAEASCTLAYWHHPLFNSGLEGNYSGTDWDTTDLWQALYDGGAELALSGHSHAYERFAPQTALGVADPEYGVREFIVGTGGKSLHDNGPTQPNSELRDNTQYGVLKLVLHEQSYDWSFVNEVGVVSDSGSGSCHGAPPDTTPPETSVSSGPEGVTTERDASFAFASSEAGSSFECKLDGPGATTGSESACDSPQPYTDLADGTYTFAVTAIDGAGNADPSGATRSFTVDATAPDTSITSGPADTIAITSAGFAFTSSEDGSTYECRFDSGAWEACSSARSYSDLAEGQHTFEVRATDAVGNTDSTPAARTFTVDLPAPAPAPSPEPDEPVDPPYTEPPATEPPPTTTPEPNDSPTPGETTGIKRYRPTAYEILSGGVHGGDGAKRLLYTDDGERLKIAGARKRSGAFVSSFFATVPLALDELGSLPSFEVNYDGGASARDVAVTLHVFNFRMGRWVRIFARTGRRDRSFDWSMSAFATDYISPDGTIRIRVTGKATHAFRTRTDLIGATSTY